MIILCLDNFLKRNARIHLSIFLSNISPKIIYVTQYCVTSQPIPDFCLYKTMFSIMALYPPCKRGTGNGPYKAFVATFALGVDPAAVRAIAQYFALAIATPYDSDCNHEAGNSPGAAVSSAQIRSEPKLAC